MIPPSYKTEILQLAYPEGVIVGGVISAQGYLAYCFLKLLHDIVQLNYILIHVFMYSKRLSNQSMFWPWKKLQQKMVSVLGICKKPPKQHLKN